MGVKQFRIEINDSPKMVFVSGQWIKGNVILELDEKTKARGTNYKLLTTKLTYPFLPKYMKYNMFFNLMISLTNSHLF